MTRIQAARHVSRAPAPPLSRASLLVAAAGVVALVVSAVLLAVEVGMLG